MKKNLLFFILLAISLLIISGCATTGGKFNLFKQKSPISKTLISDFHQGKSGLVMKVQKDNPPDTINVNESFRFVIELRNEGAVNIENGLLYLINYDPEIVNSDNKREFRLEGKNQYNPEGGLDIVEYQVTNVNMPQLKKTVFVVNSCYDYKTEASLPVCISPNKAKHLKVVDVGCEAKTVTSSGQGAPVAVTKVKQRTVPKSRGEVEMLFDIQIDNVGKGRVGELVKQCGGEQKVYVNSVTFSTFSMGDGSLVCDNLIKDDIGKYIVLQNKKESSILCRANIEKTKGAYNTLLAIDLSYGYSNSIQETVRVKYLN